MPNALVFVFSLAFTVVISAGLLWVGTKVIAGFKIKTETVFWVALVAQIYRCVASLVVQFVAPRYPVAGFVLVLCTMVYVQALALRLATGIANQEISLRRSHVVSFLTVLICFVGFMPLVAWVVKRVSA